MSVYSEFHEEYDVGGCWFCNWEPRQWSDFYPRKLESHHLLGGSGRRKHDRRQLVLVCTSCHMRAHGSRVMIRKVVHKPIPLEELLWAKKHFDPRHYDRAWLKNLRRDLPRAKKPRDV